MTNVSNYPTNPMTTTSNMSRSLYKNRDLEKLEPYEGKLSCTVLRGEEGSNALDLPDRSLSRACNTPNGSSDTVLPYSMALHRRTVCLDRLPTVVLRRSHSNDGERLPSPSLFIEQRQLHTTS